MPGKLRFDTRHRCRNLRNGAQILLLAHADVDEHLWVGHELASQVRQLASGLGHHAQHIQRRGYAVTREEVIGEDDVPRLLAADRQIAAYHLLHHVLVADRRPDHLDAAFAQSDLESDIAHHRGDDGVAFQPALRLEIPRAHQQDRIAVDDPASRVREDRSIAVTVERDAHPASAVTHGL